MKTQLLSAASPDTPALAAEIIRRGGLVAIPTETVYGLGADGLNPAAARKGHSGLRSSGAPQGAGRALWKVGSSVGIPVQSPKPPTLARLHQTNTRFNKD